MTDARRDWLLRVLGVDIDAIRAATSAVEPDTTGLDPAATWREAKDRVDAQLGKLARALSSFDDPDLDQIARFGLFGITDGQGVGLNRALLEYDTAVPGRRPAAAAGLRKAVDAFRAALNGNSAVALLDDNPFGVDVGIRATLNGALARIEREVEV